MKNERVYLIVETSIVSVRILTPVEAVLVVISFGAVGLDVAV